MPITHNILWNIVQATTYTIQESLQWLCNLIPGQLPLYHVGCYEFDNKVKQYNLQFTIYLVGLEVNTVLKINLL